MGATKAPQSPLVLVPKQSPEPLPYNNLPVQLTPLVGRESEIAAACALLRRPDARLLTLTGPPGIGKTRLAVQVALELLGHFEDGTYFVSLAPVTDPALVAPAIARTLRFDEVATQTVTERIIERLSGCKLLVLDNFEQVVAAAPFVTDLLAACPDLKVLVTSREVLHLQGEQDFPVPPLTLPAREQYTDIEALSGYEAVELFVQRARLARPGFQLTPTNAPAVARVCTRLDGLPLAIELAAARVTLFPPASILSRLENRLELLTGGARDLPARQQTLRRAIEWSYDLLAPGEKMLFRRFAVFSGGCTLEAVEAVCAADNSADPNLLEGVASLIDKSLLQQSDTGEGEPRFFMLETLGDYALSRLVASGDEERETRRRHADYYLALAERAETHLRGPEQVVWFEQLEREHDNLRQAVGWLCETGDAEGALRLAVALSLFWEVRGYWNEGRERTAAAMACSSQVSGSSRRCLVLSAARFALLNEEIDEARNLYTEGLDLARRWEDKYHVALALNGLGNIELESGNRDAGRPYYEESLALRRELGDVWSISGSLINLGMIAQHEGALERADALFSEALSIIRPTGDKSRTSLLLASLGELALEQNDPRRAYSLLQESLSLGWEVRHRKALVNPLMGMASLAHRHNQVALSAQLLGCIAAQREISNYTHHSWPEYDTLMASSRDALGEDQFAAAWSAGRLMPFEQIIAATQQMVIPDGLESTSPSPRPAETPPAPGQPQYPAGLTAREVEVLRLVATGVTNAQVADALTISTLTVNVHLRSIYAKLGVTSRTSAARFAADNRLI